MSRQKKNYEALLENWKVELENMHLYYMKKAREYYDSHDDDEYTEKELEAYEIGRINGAIDIIQTFNLMMFGGKATWNTWMGALAELEEDEGKDSTKFIDMMTGGKNAPRFTGDDEEEEDDDDV